VCIYNAHLFSAAAVSSAAAAGWRGEASGVLGGSDLGCLAEVAVKKIHAVLDSGWVADHNLASSLHELQRFFKKLNNR
jgi:hypothetical protein